MTKKLAVIAIEFDDPDDNFADASDLAVYVDGMLGDLNKLDVLVYSTPAALSADTAEGIGFFAEGREDPGMPIPSSAEDDAPSHKLG